MHRDLHIRIPRKIDPVVKPYWDLVRKHGGSRRAMVDFICSIGGYFGDHYFRSAIEFNIKAWNTDLDVDNLWKIAAEDSLPESMSAEHREVARRAFYAAHEEHKDKLWEWATESAYEGWSGSDTPYETWLGERVEWEWEVRGRGGGHLCMTRCEGINLQCRTEDLEQALMARTHVGTGKKGLPLFEWEYTHLQVRKLFIICVQNSVEITPEKVSKEVEYQAAFTVFHNLANLDEAIEEYESREDLSVEAQEIDKILRQTRIDGSTLLDSFRTICRLADVKLKEE